MVIVRLMGGLGNQMQQYAMYRKFISLGREAYLDRSWFDESNGATKRGFELDRFPNISFKFASPEQISDLIGKKSLFDSIKTKLNPASSPLVRDDSTYAAGILKRDDICLEGYWSTEKYYADVLPQLRKDFDLTSVSSEMSERACEIEHMITQAAFSCSVHIRRGDYLNPENYALFGEIATDEYYLAAFDRVRREHPDVTFFVFSDDTGYVKEKYASDPAVVIAEGNSGDRSIFDIRLMSLCNAHICANSSFSFWGARLDPGDEPLKIRPTMHVRGQKYDPVVMKDLWKGWTFFDPAGNPG